MQAETHLPSLDDSAQTESKEALRAASHLTVKMSAARTDRDESWSQWAWSQETQVQEYHAAVKRKWKLYIY